MNFALHLAAGKLVPTFHTAANNLSHDSVLSLCRDTSCSLNVQVLLL